MMKLTINTVMVAIRWPAEWSLHYGTIILFPHNPGTFRRAAHQEFVGLIRTIAEYERVFVLCKDPPHRNYVRSLFPGHSDDQNNNMIRLEVCSSNDSWARDTAPTFLVGNGTLRALDWNFNAYGGPEDGCYWPCTMDRMIGTRACEIIGSELSVEREPVDLILEGGSIHTDGEGTVLTTEECLLHPNRNPALSKEQIERVVLERTHCQKMMWLKRGLAFDEDTNGHVDNFACFASPGTVVLAWTDRKSDSENYERCREALRILEATTDAKGRSLVVHKLHLPDPIVYTKDIIDDLQFGDYEGCTIFPRECGERMAASYVNFYIANGLVLVPQFGDQENDIKAVTTLQYIFPEHQVRGIASREILIGGGNLHCVTQQIPIPSMP